jgi:hypothetical protein
LIDALTPTLSQKEREYRLSISQKEREHRLSISQKEREYRLSISPKKRNIDTEIDHVVFPAALKCGVDELWGVRKLVYVVLPAPL